MSDLPEVPARLRAVISASPAPGPGGESPGARAGFSLSHSPRCVLAPGVWTAWWRGLPAGFSVVSVQRGLWATRTQRWPEVTALGRNPSPALV